jgi:hypothetical protein
MASFAKLVDVRRGEWRSLAQAFATLLLLITAHTALETARDALVLTRLPARALGPRNDRVDRIGVAMARRGSTGSRRRDLQSMWARARRRWFARSGAC